MSTTRNLVSTTLAGLILAFGLVAPASAQTPATPSAAPAASAIDFGDDGGDWTHDGECDDPRFEGSGSAVELLDSDLLKDATDCKTAFEAGTITLRDDDTTTADTAIVFGDDASHWSNDGECDDPRFEGTGVADMPSDADRLHDAADCRAAVENGTASFKAGANNDPAAFDYGTDNSRYAHDGECDDMRFTGEGVDKKLLPEDVSADASDCRALVEAGSISIIRVYDPAYAAGAPYDSKRINFGDNTSEYADDDQCDDPRFQGPGAASVMLDGDLRHDRNDCRAAFEAGTVMLID